MTLQVVIHGIPLSSRRGAARPWGWLRGLRTLFRRRVLRLDPHSLQSFDERSSGSAQSPEDLGMWVGAIRVRQMPTQMEGTGSGDEPPPGLPPDFSPVREGYKVQRIFAQNQITSRSARSPRSPRRSVSHAHSSYPPRMVS